MNTLIVIGIVGGGLILMAIIVHFIPEEKLKAKQ
jgi:hypothetical protein